MRQDKITNKGFTLLEVLVIVAIIGLLIAIAIPAFQGILNRARIITMKSSLEGLPVIAITVKLHSHVLAHNLCPPGGSLESKRDINKIKRVLEKNATAWACTDHPNMARICLEATRVINIDGTITTLCGDSEGNIYLGGVCQAATALCVPDGFLPPPLLTELQITPTTITATLVQGTGWTDIRTVNVTNPGGGTLSWSATVAPASATWLKVVPPITGTTTTEIDTVTIQVNATGLALGIHTGTITFTGAYPAIGSPDTVTVTLTVTAAPLQSVLGWAWSENIGWISFSSKNCDTDGDGIFEGAGEGVQPVPVNCPITGTAHAYGVEIDPATGNMFGYAWSENIGWIDFNPTMPAGLTPAYSARINLATGEVSGWARVLAHGHGWDGWIKMRGVATDPAATPYGVYVDFATGHFSGWAWSDMVVGWISFNNTTSGTAVTYRVYIK